MTEQEQDQNQQAEQAGSAQSSQELYGVLARFPDQDSLVEAAESVRDAGFTRWDAHSPYPIHGMERAMGIRNTGLPWIVFVCGISGAAAALLLQWWTNAVDYPLNISGKPIFSLPANIPVTFELIILFSAFAAFFGVLALNGLPRFSNPLFKHPSFLGVTSDRFFIAIEAKDKRFDEASVDELLNSAHAASVEKVYEDAKQPAIPLTFHLVGVVALCVAFIPPLWIARDRATTSEIPRIHPVTDMDFQAKYQAQAESAFFEDGRTMRPPVTGTVARGELQADGHFYRGVAGGEFAEMFPDQLRPLDMTLMERGEERYKIFCATCHGLGGDGDGITSQRALAREDSPGWRPPLSLHSEAVLVQPIGQIFNTITNGVDRENDGTLSMPAYASQIEPRDRWAIVLYVLALQRSRNSQVRDMPPGERETLEIRDLERMQP